MGYAFTAFLYILTNFVFGWGQDSNQCGSTFIPFEDNNGKDQGTSQGTSSESAHSDFSDFGDF